MLETKIIPIPLGESPSVHAYLIVTSGEGVLIDPGRFQHAATLLKAIESHIPIHRVKHVILQCTHCSNTASLHYLKERGLSATVYHNHEGSLDIGKDFEEKRVQENHHELSLRHGEKLFFIKAPFLPFPDAFMTFFSERNALFSANVFSQDSEDHDSHEALEQSLRTYHMKTMPSSEFLRPVLKQLEAYPVRHIYPSRGESIKGDSLRAIFSFLRQIDFYNTDLVRHSTKTKRRAYNYPLILNHVLKQLEKHYDSSEIMEVFKDSPITLEHNVALEIKHSSLSGYKLWNRFFEEIYREKGLVWLTLLEPVMRKYTRLYNIRVPSIYKSELVQNKLKVKQLSEEKSELESRFEKLNQTLETTTEQLLRCPITNLYNAQFFKRHLQNRLEEGLNGEKKHGFLTVRIDGFKDLNRKHGKTVGDETLQNAAYLIERLKPEEALLFRSEGPGFYVYFEDTSHKTMQEVAVKLRNGIRDSSLFIETVQVSIALMTVDEVEDHDPVVHTRRLLDLSNERLELSLEKGGGQVIDSSNRTSLRKDGTILLVDEDETIQNLMVQIFSRVRYDVRISKDIYEAYDFLQENRVDVVISEINLSKLDGLQFKRWMNDSHAFQNIPFIIASHHKNREVIKRANALGVELVLKKPLIPEELIGHVKRMRERGRGL